MGARSSASESALKPRVGCGGRGAVSLGRTAHNSLCPMQVSGSVIR